MTTSPSASFPASELPLGGMRVVLIDGREVVVCRTKDGLHALDNECTHAWARMCEGRLRGERLVCPLHGGSFDVRDGRPLAPPATKPLALHRAQEVGDLIEVSLGSG